MLDPLPWALLHPIHVQSTPVLVTTTTDLLQETADCFAQTRVPLVMDATQNKDVVDLFWTVGVYGHRYRALSTAFSRAPCTRPGAFSLALCGRRELYWRESTFRRRGGCSCR